MLPLRILLPYMMTVVVCYFTFLLLFSGALHVTRQNFLWIAIHIKGFVKPTRHELDPAGCSGGNDRMSSIIVPVRILTRLATSCLAAYRQSSVHSIAPSHEERKLHSKMVRPLLLNNPVCKQREFVFLPDHHRHGEKFENDVHGAISRLKLARKAPHGDCAAYDALPNTVCEPVHDRVLRRRTHFEIVQLYGIRVRKR